MFGLHTHKLTHAQLPHPAVRTTRHQLQPGNLFSRSSGLATPTFVRPCSTRLLQVVGPLDCYQGPGIRVLDFNQRVFQVRFRCLRCHSLKFVCLKSTAVATGTKEINKDSWQGREYSYLAFDRKHFSTSINGYALCVVCNDLIVGSQQSKPCLALPGKHPDYVTCRT